MKSLDLVIANSTSFEASGAVDKVVLPRPYKPLVKTQFKDLPANSKKKPFFRYIPE